MEELQRQFVALEATVRAGFTAEAQRSADFRREMATRHDENRERLERIEEKQDKTNGNVARHDAEIRNLADQQRGLWKQCRELGDKISRFLSGRQIEPSRGSHSVSREDLRTLLAVMIGTATITAAVVLWVLKMAGKL